MFNAKLLMTAHFCVHFLVVNTLILSCLHVCLFVFVCGFLNVKCEGSG